MKQNFQAELDNVLQTLPQNPPKKLLLHSCCGPCSTYVLTYLAQYFDITVIFYNPNIMPKEEYFLRLKTQKEVLEKMSLPHPVKIVECGYDVTEFLDAVKGFEDQPERGKRCEICIELRIRETAKYAKENGFDYFCTTLSVSPHKDATLINKLTKEYAEQFDLPYLPTDFKKRNGYLTSIQLSKELGLYRQNYCGCIFSKK